MCDRFNTQPSLFIFLISTMAGGTGLNLTAGACMVPRRGTAPAGPPVDSSSDCVWAGLLKPACYYMLAG
jgi:hypothetical protein